MTRSRKYPNLLMSLIILYTQDLSHIVFEHLLKFNYLSVNNLGYIGWFIDKSNKFFLQLIVLGFLTSSSVLNRTILFLDPSNYSLGKELYNDI